MIHWTSKSRRQAKEDRLKSVIDGRRRPRRVCRILDHPMVFSMRRKRTKIRGELTLSQDARSRTLYEKKKKIHLQSDTLDKQITTASKRRPLKVH